MNLRNCPFCDYKGPSEVLRETSDLYVIAPLDPVTPGHLLVIPKTHIQHFAEKPGLVGHVFAEAARLAGPGDSNLIASDGLAATQTVPHLHVHIVPRREGDGLALPWTGQGR